MPAPSFTVTYLLAAFRRALQAMAPIAQDVGHAWRDGEAYDQWDAVEENLFDVLVVSAITGDRIAGDRRPPGRYGFAPSLETRTVESCLEVELPERQAWFSFLRFSAVDDFGVMEVRPMDDSGRSTGDVETVPWTPEVTFRVRLRALDRPDLLVDRVTPTHPGWPIVRREY